MQFNASTKDLIISPKKLFSDDEESEDYSDEDSSDDSDDDAADRITDPKLLIAQHEKLEKEAAQIANKYRQQKKRHTVNNNNTIGSPKQQAGQSKKAKKSIELSPDQIFSPAALYEPIRGLESEIARNCQVITV
jgi:hypothetical protein